MDSVTPRDTSKDPFHRLGQPARCKDSLRTALWNLQEYSPPEWQSQARDARKVKNIKAGQEEPKDLIAAKDRDCPVPNYKHLICFLQG